MMLDGLEADRKSLGDVFIRLSGRNGSHDSQFASMESGRSVGGRRILRQTPDRIDQAADALWAEPVPASHDGANAFNQDPRRRVLENDTPDTQLEGLEQFRVRNSGR